MPVSVTVTGSSADVALHAQGSGFGAFKEFSAFASEQLSFGSSGLTGTGTVSLTLDTSYGELVFSGSDTIGAASGSYAFISSETLSFVVGSDTLTLASSGTVDVGSGTAGLERDIEQMFSSVLSGDNVLGGSLTDTVSAGLGSDIAKIMHPSSAATHTGGHTEEHRLSDNSTIQFFKLGH